ncbi:MAG: GNAT family N-acetyltransferase [Candidatus Hodarchaeales archaeon]
MKYTVDILNEENYHLAIKPFVKAMDFAQYYGNEQEIEEWILQSVEMFSSKARFHGVGIREESSINDSYVGFASLIPVETTGWIPYVGVDPTYQGQGLGKKVLLKILEIAEEMNLESIELCSSQKGINFYQSLGFQINYPVCGYDILEPNRPPEKDLSIDNHIPEWVYTLDQKVVGIDRKSLIHLHNYKELTIINEPNHGYGILYKTRIGPIIADSLTLAQEIILKSVELGATSLVLVEDAVQKKKIHEVLKLKPQPLMNNTKMTYGSQIHQDVGKLYGLRSVAYG